MIIIVYSVYILQHYYKTNTVIFQKNTVVFINNSILVLGLDRSYTSFCQPPPVEVLDGEHIYISIDAYI